MLTDREREVAAEAAEAVLVALLRDRDGYRQAGEQYEAERDDIRAEIARALYGWPDPEAWMDNPLVFEVARVVDELLRLNGGPLEGDDE